ncbi:FIG056164: rhomboid family serine protease [[Actinomadura] parvosata subsp. kistnae]|uniref:Rhomboid family intramembrane serine protease n=1 Tax=[Actinomadura] parvosata subsp. kistnae TaxID=1909395 RepID=A0A1V0ABY8_9ACTN|nr:rhomboid family intramembrane serine protease [Nonomuraea sp. ATCC 55076]AQZ67703.1 rhomboid family intramembrane serine protease [Nonomuraea sp. ATCC 55076]SPL94007.1 FIG056164: rhomboid family serine protease [Actinomadura parvosata subsp. kistnae]
MTSQPPSPPSQPEQPAEAVPTCYRHPDKETWVRCQRCERPICPDCMRDAAVGFQCPECVAEGNKGIRQARSTFGGNVVRTPFVTYALLVINVLVFGAQYLVGDRLTGELAMWPGGVAVFGEYHRLITAAFVHGSVFHILFNCWALFVVGPYLERAFGHVRYTALYLISALGGSVLGLWLDPLNQPTVGASGAIFGLFGAAFVVGRKLNMDVRGMAVLIALNLAITFLVPGISWTGHVGGLITGSLLAGALAYAPKNSRTLWQVLAIAAALVLLAVLVLVRTSAILTAA